LKYPIDGLTKLTENSGNKESSADADGDGKKKKETVGDNPNSKAVPHALLEVYAFT
jgi:hypothetical protein